MNLFCEYDYIISQIKNLFIKYYYFYGIPAPLS